jgi:hypothetical protein
MKEVYSYAAKVILLILLASLVSACEDHSFKPIEFDCQTTCSLENQCAIENCGGVLHTCVVLEGVPLWSADTIRCDDQNPCTVSDQCIQETCQGIDKICDQPPANYCDDNALVTYPATGSCQDDGSCDYPIDVLVCEESCTNAQCQGSNCDCGDRVCGDNNCGGSCGTCDANYSCNESGQCECAFLECGDFCCGQGENCVDGLCKWERPFKPQFIISSSIVNPTSVFAADVDGDNDLDLLVGSYEEKKIYWLENTDGLATFDSPKLVTTNSNIQNVRSVYATDLDGDNDIDVLTSASDDEYKFTWYNNTDGLGSFEAVKTGTTGFFSFWTVLAADLDQDGDQDVISAGVGRITWMENSPTSNGGFGQERRLPLGDNAALGIGERIAIAADLDGDDDIDIVSTDRNEDSISWHENTDGWGSFGEAQVITTFADNIYSVYTADIDGDGDIDVLSASLDDGRIAWYENTDGQGSFGPQQIISNSTSAISVYTADLDLDGDQDVIGSIYKDDTDIVWYENTDGLGSFGPEQVITLSAPYSYSIIAADLDGDGDQDIISASHLPDLVSWYENTKIP